MKLEVGMYFRTKAGTINKIDNFTENKGEFYFNTKPIFSDEECLGSNWGYTKDIIKASYEIIDLIEERDILEINGEKYEVIYDESYEKLGILIPSRKELSIRHSALEYVFKKYKVAILTKEQFEQMAYKVGE